MKFKFLLCIDDTDELAGEISTGLLAEEISAFAGSFAPVSFVTRHQFLLYPRINYTSHNSSMCLEARLTESQKQSVLDFALRLLEHKSALGAEPGIAAAFEKDIVNTQELISFGRSAKEIFLSTEQAFETAHEQNVFLKELKSGARGVIGALAGIGLRLSGNDGKIRGKFEIKESNLSVAELLGLNFIEAVADENFKPLSPDERVNLIGALKPVFLDFKATLLVKKEAGGGFRNLSVKELRRFLCVQILTKKASLNLANLTMKKRAKPPKIARNLSSTTTMRRWRAAARLAATTALLDAGARRVLPARCFSAR